MSIPHTTPLIQLTTRDDLSLLYRLLRALIRPLRPRLVGLQAPQPAGSPKLRPPKTKTAIRERHVEGMYVYDFGTPDHISSTRHQLFYFAGGGFQSPPSSEHWKFCAELSNRLQGIYQVTLVSYPLAPKSPAAESLRLLQNWLRAVGMDAACKGDSVTLMGDSAGGNIAITLGLWWAEHIREHQIRSVVKNVFAISPPTDLRTNNPAIAEADKHDPVLTAKLSADVGKAWAAGMRLDHPDISPLFADLTLLRHADVKVHGVVGTYDVLAPDAIKFREACNEAGVSGQWLEWKGQMHCFPLTFSYGLSEGKQSKEWIVEVLKRNV